MTPDQLIAACRVPAWLEPGRAGLWEIARVELPAGSIMRRFSDEISPVAPFDSLTMLFRDTLATLNEPHGECVMEDSPRELRRHLPILMAANGNVLVSGLGLGCVVRGLLAKREVEHIDVVEIDPAIVKLVGAEFERNPRVTIHVDDAETIEWNDGERWDFAWHDVWSERESLDVVHARLIARYFDRVGRQGVWGMARTMKRFFPKSVIGGPRRRQAAFR